MNLYLIGYRCTGKTTVGKALAGKTGRVFVDADQALVEAMGMSVADMVARNGWEAFRSKETEILKRLSQGTFQVIATGGGVVLRSENVEAMKASGKIVWLAASVETISRRMETDPATGAQRPSLTGKTLREEIIATLSERLPLYESAADAMVDTDGKNVRTICLEIADRMGRIPVTG